MAIVSLSESCFSITGSPLTMVPLVLPRSLIQNEPARTSMRPWWPEVAGSPTTTSLSGARPIDTIWLGRATMRPAKGPDSNVSSAANPDPEAISSGGSACSDTVCFESAFGSVCCQTGITDVASSNDPASAGAPFSGMDGAVFDGHATRVELTSGAARGTGSAKAAAPAGSCSGSGAATSAATGSGSATVSSNADSAGSVWATTSSGSGSAAATGSGLAAAGSTSASASAVTASSSSSVSGSGRSGSASGSTIGAGAVANSDTVGWTTSGSTRATGAVGSSTGFVSDGAITRGWVSIAIV